MAVPALNQERLQFFRPWSPDSYLRALLFAAKAHDGQLLTGSKLPYLTHVVTVAMEVIVGLRESPECDGDLAVQCALLHDVVEDTSATLQDVEREFGPRVVAGVAALTKDKSLPASERMADSLRRILAQPPEVAMVKLADRITNLQPPPAHWTKSKIAEYRAEARQILAALGASHAGLAARLAQKIEAYRAYE